MKRAAKKIALKKLTPKKPHSPKKLKPDLWAVAPREPAKEPVATPKAVVPPEAIVMWFNRKEMIVGLASKRDEIERLYFKKSRKLKDYQFHQSVEPGHVAVIAFSRKKAIQNKGSEE